ncbi:SMC-Scp complex subunit ScpB [Microvirga sp. 0TCS3.31]
MSEQPDSTQPDPGPVEDADAGTENGIDTLDVAVAELRPALEAILMVSDEPLGTVRLASVVGHPVEDVEAALEALAGEYAEQGRGFDLRPVAGGWRFYSRPEFAGVVESFVLEGQQARLTRAALETLSVVAYKQPVSRARVSAIRGVNVDGVMRTLLTRGLVEEAGQDELSGANLYRTTSYFLERIGVTSLDELPELAPYLPDMDDLEDELASVAGLDAPAEPAPEPAAEPAPADVPPAPQQPQQAPRHASPHSGDGTEPDGGTEIS